MKSIKDQVDLNQKNILLRLDLNVPLENGVIADTTRIDKILPTIKYLLEKNAKIIILSHVGRPKGKVVKELSLEPICEDLKIKLKTDIKLITKNIREINSTDLFKNQNEKIVILENLRFYGEEEKNDNAFAKHLASLADIYVNDAFSCSHRAHASIFEITKFITSYSGLQLDLEIEALTKITSEIKKPITCIIGGSKISSKINIIKNLISKFNNIIIVGGMANNILKYQGYEIGKSLLENSFISEANKLLNSEHGHKIILPTDFGVTELIESELREDLNIEHFHNMHIGIDIGPNTVSLFSKYLLLPYIPGAGELTVFCAAIVGSGLAFLWFNAYPAQVFMGDVGALALGGAIGVVAIVARQEIVLFIMGGVFVIETLSVMLQVGYFKYTKKRFGIGKRILKMAPLHHHFEESGWKETQVVVRFWIITMMLVLVGLATLKIR